MPKQKKKNQDRNKTAERGGEQVLRTLTLILSRKSDRFENKEGVYT